MHGISKGADLNAKGPGDFATILSVIAANGSAEFNKFCFENSAKLTNAKIIENIFEKAVGSGNLQVVEEIQAHGYNFSMHDWEDSKAATLLETAYNVGGFPMLAKCCSFGASARAISLAAEKVELAVITENDRKTFDLLESEGIPFDAKKIFGKYGAHKFFRTNAKGYDLVLEILEQLSSIDLRAFLNENLAAILGSRNPVLLKYAFDHGSDPNMLITDIFGSTPLIFKAIDTGKPNLVNEIIQAGADLSVKYQNKTLVEHARIRGELEIVKLIQEQQKYIKR